ncbi:uncharacterized protein LOC131431884 [Malaya genurostris]|uniref:uncharacterized protein LOC131431884 n=1 Tax=Malaya genurostris TaxID=325434 RepID=UPI0026F3D78F|nr:uncharacterized protein LOC131431884 [Malaya genurostris]
MHLKDTDADWNIDVVFDVVRSWRKRNQAKITSFLQSVSENVNPETSAENGRKSGNEHNVIERKLLESQIYHEREPKKELSHETTDTLNNKLNNNNTSGAPFLTDTKNYVINIANDFSSEELAQQDITVSDVSETCFEVHKNLQHETAFTPRFLYSLLQQTEEGKDIIERAKIGELSETKQLELAGIIAKYHLISKKKVQTEQLETYTLAICTLFQSERQENYYISRGGDRRNPGGKIANKIGNLKQKKRRIDVREAEYAKTRKLTASRELPLDSTTNEAVNWLELNGEPWNTVLEKWSVSAAHRRQYLKNRKFTLKLLNLYPHYKKSYGYQLVDIDFRFLYEDARNGIAVLESTITGIISYASKKAQDPSALKLLKYLNNNTNSLDARMIALLLVLNTVLPPIHASSRFKPTIYVAQEDTIVFVNKEDEIKSKIDSTG